MKDSEASFDSLGKIRKFTKTPSTVHSLSSSPPLQNYQEKYLIKSLRQRQSQLAGSLKKYSEDLGMQVPALHYRWDLVNIRWEKLRKYKETLVKALSKIKNDLDIKALIKNTENQEEENEKLLRKTEEVFNQLQKLKKKFKSLKKHSKKEILIRENQHHYEKKFETLKILKKELGENLIEIKEYQVKIASLYEPVNLKLEEIMISKEELLLSLPHENSVNQILDEEKKILQNKITENNELKKIIYNLDETYREFNRRNMGKSNEQKSQRERLDGKFALARVQQRFLNEKKARIEVASNELHAISSAFDSAMGNPAVSDNKSKNKSKSVMRQPKITHAKIAANKSLNK